MSPQVDLSWGSIPVDFGKLKIIVYSAPPNLFLTFSDTIKYLIKSFSINTIEWFCCMITDEDLLPETIV